MTRILSWRSCMAAMICIAVFIGGCDDDDGGADDNGLQITPAVSTLDPAGDGAIYTASGGTSPYAFDIAGAAADGFVLPDCVSFSDNGDGTAVVGVTQPTIASASTATVADGTLSAVTTAATVTGGSATVIASVPKTADDVDADIVVHSGPTVATLSVTDAAAGVAYATINFTPSVDGWIRTHDGIWCGDSDSCIQRTSDGGAIVVGKASTLTTGTTGMGNGDVWVVRLDADRSVAWERAFGHTTVGGAHAAIQTSDGGFLVLGHYINAGVSAYGAWLLKLDTAGAITWHYVYSESSMTGTCVQETFDGAGASTGYVLCGMYSTATGTDAVLLKLDQSGAVSWQNEYGGAGPQGARSVRQVANGGGYVVVGYDDPLGGDRRLWAFEVSADGSTVAWQKRYEATGVTGELFSVDVARDATGALDGFIVAGFSYFDVGGSVWAEHPCVLRIDTDGTVLWQKQFRGAGNSVEERAYCVRQTADLGFIAAGSVMTDLTDNDSDAWVARLGTDGSVSWQKQYETDGENLAVRSIALEPDGGFLLAATAIMSDAAMWLARINSDGTLGQAP